MPSTKNKFKSGLERSFHKQIPLPYEVNRLAYTVEHTYTPDFTLGPNLFVETKGLFAASDRGKHLFVKSQHPEVKVLFVFQNPHLRLSKKSTTTYAMWCDKHNFRWLHINSIAGHTSSSLRSLLNSTGVKVK